MSCLLTTKFSSSRTVTSPHSAGTSMLLTWLVKRVLSSAQLRRNDLTGGRGVRRGLVLTFWHGCQSTRQRAVLTTGNPSEMTQVAGGTNLEEMENMCLPSADRVPTQQHRSSTHQTQIDPASCVSLKRGGTATIRPDRITRGQPPSRVGAWGSVSECESVSSNFQLLEVETVVFATEQVERERASLPPPCQSSRDQRRGGRPAPA